MSTLQNVSEDLLLVPTQSGPTRMAKIVADEPLTVVWKGSTKPTVLEALPAGARRLRIDSIEGQLARNPEKIKEALTSAELALHLVHTFLWETKRALTVRQLQEELAALGQLSVSESESLFKGLLPMLRKRRGIESTEQDWSDLAGPTYEPKKIRGKPAPTKVIVLSASAPSPDMSGLLKGSSSETVEKTKQKRPASSKDGSDRAVEAMPESSLQRVHLIWREHSNVKTLRKIEIHSLNPDDVRLSFAALPATDRQAIVDSISNTPKLAPLLLATAESSVALESMISTWPQTDAAKKHLREGLIWLDSLTDESARKTLLEGLKSHHGPHQFVIADVAVCQLASGVRGHVSDWLDVLVGMPSGCLRRIAANAEWPAVLEHINREPLDKRWPLLVQAHKVNPANVENLSAWGVVRSVAQLGFGSADRISVFENPWVLENIVLPTMEKDLKTTSSLGALERILECPAAASRSIDPDLVVQAVLRFAKRSELFGAVIHEISRVDEMEGLRSEVLRSDKERNKLLMDLMSLQERVATAEEALKRQSVQQHDLEERLRLAGARQIAASNAVLRQERIDGIRVAVDILASATLSSSGNAIEAAVNAASRHGVHPIGTLHERVPYEGAMHELLGATAATFVEVREPGWLLKDSQGTHVLRKAAVVKVES